MNFRKYIPIVVCMLCSVIVLSQKSYLTFKDTRVINSQSVETIGKSKLDFRIGHRFGDIGDGWTSFYGLENATDVLFEFDYGLTDNIMVGIMRTKGSGELRQIVSGLFKARILKQSEAIPISVAFSSLMSFSTMKKNDPPRGLINDFELFAHRIVYNTQVIIASKVSERLSLQVAPQLTYRNFIPDSDETLIPSIRGAFKLQISRSVAIILDGTYVISDLRSQNDQNGSRRYYHPLEIGIEWDTGGGHVFQMNFTNATGILETDYIPYTTSNWLENEYRLGFTISRQFNL